MKLAFIYPESLPSKFARAMSVLQTCRHLFEQEPTFSLVTTDAFNNESLERQFDFALPQKRVIQISKRFGPVKSNRIFHWHLKWWLRKHSVDVLYTRHIKTAAFLLRHKSPHQRVIFESHQLFFTTTCYGAASAQAKKLYRLEAYVYQNVDAVTFINKTLEKEVQATFDIASKPTSILYNAIAPTPEPVTKGFGNMRDFYYIGNLPEWKGVKQLIEVMTYFPNCRLHIVGGDNARVIDAHQQAASQHGVSERVVFHGFQSQQRVKTLLAEQACLVFIPNTQSAWTQYSLPIKLLEYMNFGNIVIASDMPTIRELFEHGIHGFLYETGNIDALRRAITEAMNSPKERLLAMSENAQRAARGISWENRAAQLLSFAKEVFARESITRESIARSNDAFDVPQGAATKRVQV